MFTAILKNQKKVYVVNEKHRDFYKALRFVWNKYRNYDGLALTELTHRDNTAWAEAKRLKQLNIPDEAILKEAWYP